MFDDDFVSKVQVPPDADSLQLLQAVYRSPHVAMSVRMRAAAIALPFERPKLGVTLNVAGGVKDFAALLEERRRLRQRRVIDQPATIPTDCNAAKLPRRF
jgi:hypothetical protein